MNNNKLDIKWLLIVLLGISILSLLKSNIDIKENFNSFKKERDSTIFINKFLIQQHDKEADSLFNLALQHENKIVNIENNYNTDAEEIIENMYNTSFIDSLYKQNLQSAKEEFNRFMQDSTGG